jgi:hypothetical protein
MADSLFRARAAAPLGLLLALLATACGPSLPKPSQQALRDARDTGTRTPPAGNTEKAILLALEKLPANQPQTIGGTLVLAEAEYFAASGRYCRRLTLGAPQEASFRLACRDESGWFFVPSVSEPSAAP